MRPAKNRISLRGLRTFCVVAQRGSFRLAAEDLFLTPSAISHRVKNLEAELEVNLFDRNARELRLTEAGDILLRDSESLIAQLDEVASRFHARYGQRTLRVTVQPFFATEMLVPRLSGFLSENPNISINIDTEDQSAEKHPAEADVSIRLFRKTPKNLSVKELFRLRLVPACAPDLLNRMPTRAVDTLQGFPLILHSRRPQAWRDWAQLTGMQLEPRTSTIRLETMISVARAAEQGLGVALVPLPLSEGWFQSGKLLRLSETELETRDRYLVVSREEDAQRPEVEVFRRWILQEFAQG